MRFERLGRIHFIGIAGVGMSGIAEVLLTMGFKVSGSDLRSNDTTERLKSLGAVISEGHSPGNVAGAELAVFSSAVGRENPEIVEAARIGIPVIPRGEMLAELTRLKDSAVVSGSHGKTTVTAMISHIAHDLGLDPTVIIGGRLSSIGSTARLGRSSLMVAEADESDRSFLLLHPSVGVITNIDWEHVDTYPSLESMKDAYVEFANKVPFYGAVVAFGDDPNVREIMPKFRRRTITYGFHPSNEWTAAKAGGGDGESFEVFFNGKSAGLFGIPQKGTHMILNSLASIAVSSQIGVPPGEVARSLASFPGVDRRFQLVGRAAGVRIYDDYAHHPTEMKALFDAARSEAGNGRMVALFQPHRFTRLQKFEDDFARVLLSSDVAVVTEVYAASELPIPGITGEALVNKTRKLGHGNCHFVPDVADVAGFVAPLLREGDLVMTVGAGTITKVGPALARLLGAENEL
ncbi:MAG TPA: UDP-N-acetylmuramate--L-alanine ligase [Acidobacteriota bacterium]|nr:UDP-N-acetylmuramate--L-alanine ligase [Acidobacteriota bacterium]HNT17340.1 UDP-N-acetylmuramate--L-alanine ligase [Acidobacteriota bacterium]